MSDIVAPERRERPDPVAGRALAEALPDDSFAQVCGLGGLVIEARLGEAAALWRGHPWGSGWVAGGDAGEISRLLDEHAPGELTLPESLGLPPGHRRGWGWGWHALRSAPPVQPGEERVDWLVDEREVAAFVATAFPDAETPPGDPRVQRWFGGREAGRLVACAAEMRIGAGAGLLSSLAVAPSGRRRGWGAAVTAWFVRERFASGTRVVGLGTYLGNTGARALYDRLGFADVPYLGAVREA